MPAYKLPNLSTTYDATGREKMFLKHLGHWRDGTENGDRLSLLRNYRDTLHLRNNWGQIDPEKVWDLLIVLIDREEDKIYVPAPEA